MVQISTGLGGRLSTVEGSVAGVARIAEIVKATSSGGGGHSDGDGAELERDQQHLAASGKFVAEGKARSAANANAAEASALLQIADEALVAIRARLDQLTGLALAAEETSLSITDRARMDVTFQTVKAEIDTIAADTAFNRIKLLQGGTGAGGAFEISFKVGTGNEDHDDIMVSIAASSVSDLSAGLEVGSIASMVGAATARTNVAAARDVLDTIRSGIAGDMERFSIASRNNTVIGQQLAVTRDLLTTPSVVIDLAQMVARRAAEDGGFDLSGRTVDQLRNLLIRLGDQEFAISSAPKPDTGESAGQSGATGGTTTQDAPSNQPDGTRKDAA